MGGNPPQALFRLAACCARRRRGEARARRGMTAGGCAARVAVPAAAANNRADPTTLTCAKAPSLGAATTPAQCTTAAAPATKRWSALSSSSDPSHRAPPPNIRDPERGAGQGRARGQPSSTSRRTTARPMKPLAPVTATGAFMFAAATPTGRWTPSYAVSVSSQPRRPASRPDRPVRRAPPRRPGSCHRDSSPWPPRG